MENQIIYSCHKLGHMLENMKNKNDFYKDGKYDNEYKSWWNNGQLHEHCYNKNGLVNGEYKMWDHHGQLLKYCFYKNGKIIKRIKLNI